MLARIYIDRILPRYRSDLIEAAAGVADPNAISDRALGLGGERGSHIRPDPPAPGTATEVAPGVLWLRLPLPMKLDHVNVYALDEGDGWTVVDTGFDSAKARAIWQMLLDGPLAAKPVTRVIATHHHPDHLGLAGWFMERGRRCGPRGRHG